MNTSINFVRYYTKIYVFYYPKPWVEHGSILFQGHIFNKKDTDPAGAGWHNNILKFI